MLKFQLYKIYLIESISFTGLQVLLSLSFGPSHPATEFEVKFWVCREFCELIPRASGHSELQVFPQNPWEYFIGFLEARKFIQFQVSSFHLAAH